jgi:hypothetical protein
MKEFYWMFSNSLFMNSSKTIEHLTEYFCHPLHVAAALNGMSITDFKKVYMAHGIKRWPYNKYRTKTSPKLESGFQDFQITHIQREKPEQKKPSSNYPNTKQKLAISIKNEYGSDFEEFCNSLNNEINKSFEKNFSEVPLFNPVIL